ncbi:hypothetical protein K3N28_15460 [Glycomyces sp. TRM65418]|uniref:hypothetical protein n=1 Tax=Glycomyces sp. TRM65418 TaxID=2867006 RepID=UPI001CE6D02F|nr:hypothetical protein [Glycomyces sp. TRM65418]MCC3764460.1 hypothetical protein [Glycomyces sp. TRM65418]QZD54133.1 hypothetical protein K3N28_15385 [Glycomyces sp. TRM65418]
MTDIESKILEELKNISFLMGDLNFIRNGEYDPPLGSGSTGRAVGSQATPNDLAVHLASIAGSLEQIAEDTAAIREAVVGEADGTRPWYRSEHHPR